MMLSGKFIKFHTTTTEKKAHKNHLSRSQVVERFVQNSEINLSTIIRCLICHWKTGCLHLPWQYYEKRRVLGFFSWGNAPKVMQPIIILFFSSVFRFFFSFGKISQTLQFLLVLNCGLFLTPKILMTSRTSLMF